jgi:hypothetical protein
MPEGALAMVPPLIALTDSVDVAGVEPPPPPPHAAMKKTTIISMYANEPLAINRCKLPMRKKK